MKTKLAFAQAIKKCMVNYSLDEITITQIADEANLSRQTFYRLFLDKYDLVNWYFDQLLFQSFKEMGEGKTLQKGLEKKFDFIKQEATFFNRAFQSDAQNSLMMHDYTQILNFYKDLIKRKGQTTLPFDIEFSLEVYCYGTVYKTVDWLQKKTPLSPYDLSLYMIKALPKNIVDYYQELDIQI